MSAFKRAPKAPLTPEEFIAAAAGEPLPARDQLVNSFCVEHKGHRNPDAVRDAQAVAAWRQRMLRAGYRYRSADRRVAVTVERLRTIIRTADRPRERRDSTGRSSARSGDSGDDGPSDGSVPPADVGEGA